MIVEKKINAIKKIKKKQQLNTIRRIYKKKLLIMRLEKEWPSRADEVCDLLSFLELPLVTRVGEKVKKKLGSVHV